MHGAIPLLSTLHGDWVRGRGGIVFLRVWEFPIIIFFLYIYLQLILEYSIKKSLLSTINIIFYYDPHIVQYKSNNKFILKA